MIKKILPLLLILSCSHLSNPQYGRKVSSVEGRVSRIVQLTSKQKYHVDDYESVKLSFRVYKFSMFTSSDQVVEIKNKKSLGSFESDVEYTDKRGVVNFIYRHKYKNEKVYFDIVAGGVTFNVSFEVYGAIERDKIEPIKLKPRPIVISKPQIEVKDIEIKKPFNKINYENSYIELLDTRVVPTGVDYFKVKLFLDSQSQIIKIKNGEYECLVIPNVSETKIELKMFADEKIIDTKVAELSFSPLLEEISDTRMFTSMASLDGFTNDVTFSMDDSKREGDLLYGSLQGINLTNRGANKIVPKECAPTEKGNESSCRPQRTFDIEFREQATQNMKIRVNDYVNEWLSQTMHSDFVFFPRKVIPHIKIQGDGSYKLTLPTGEAVYFDSESMQITGGVLEEGPLDNKTKNRFSRKFPDISYKGDGVVIRVNARGQTPSQGQFNNATISGEFGNIGGKSAMIYKYDKKSNRVIKCLRPKADLWEQGDINPIPFRFASDESFREYLAKHCNFSF